METKLIIIIAYAIISLICFIGEYRSVKRSCRYSEKPKLDYCIIRGLFFPLVIIRKIYDYIIK